MPPRLISAQFTGKICSQPTPFGAGRAMKILCDESCEMPPRVRDGIQDRFVAGDRELGHVVALTGTLRNHVIRLAVVREHVDSNLRILKVIRQVLLDRIASLFERQAGDVHLAVGGQVNSAVRTDEVLAADLLRARCRRERHRHDWIINVLRQPPANLGLRLVRRQTDHLHATIRRPQIDVAFRRDEERIRDRLIGKRIRHADQDRIERLQLMRRLRNNLHRLQKQNIGWLNHV